MDALEHYLRELRHIRATGHAVAETSYYGRLEELFNTVGSELSPRVRAVINIRSSGAGLPDGGLFTRSQITDVEGDPLRAKVPPSRGVLEVKGTQPEVEDIARTEQVRKYLDRYGKVLVTNYRSFLLVTSNPSGEPMFNERYDLAESEDAFWSSSVPTLVREHSERFHDFLKRVFVHGAPIRTPKDLAWILASYAKEALGRLEGAELQSLDDLKEAFEASLGIEFSDEKGDRFFKSALVQTLFYGVFSAWILWDRNKPAGQTFEWRTSAWYLQVPEGARWPEERHDLLDCWLLAGDCARGGDITVGEKRR